jgi:ATP-dependent Clp protease ATP-binding subunit ClpC
MSEYMTKWDASRLTGAAPGYTGYENGGQLTNLVKENPSAVLCIDEIEKADSDIFNVFLQIMEDGVLTSNQGEIISFKDILIIMTSNIGITEINQNTIGFSGHNNPKKDIKMKITSELKKTFKPEFLNRIDDIIIFRDLSEQDILQICKILLKKVKTKANKLGIKINFDKSAIAKICEIGYNKEYGARPLKRAISKHIEDMLADKILSGEIKSGDEISIIFSRNNFNLQHKNAVISTYKYGEINE